MLGEKNWRQKLVKGVALGVAFWWSAWGHAVGLWAATPAEAAASYLEQVMDQFHHTMDVYTDSHAAGSHFVMRGLMPSAGALAIVPPMEEGCRENPRSGLTCIKALFEGKDQQWGGWYFLNGVLQGEEIAPKSNWGDYPNAGLNLQGSTELSFWVRGSRGGEQVEFFCCGVGWDPDRNVRIQPYPDSSPKISTGYITLTKEWQRVTINLTGRDLSYVLGGFGWVSVGNKNNNQDVLFYLDDIQFNKGRLEENRFLVSYKVEVSNLPFDEILRNTAFTYDNALALLSFVALGNQERARKIADSLCYAWQNDRYYREGWLRNAYQGGDLVLFPGWTPHGYVGTVRMPGWWDDYQKQWFEDEFQVSIHTGNIAWAMLGLLGYYKAFGGENYLNMIKQMGEWVEQHCRNSLGPGGYTGGYEGWEPNIRKLSYKATEHNIDLYAAFLRLYHLTKDPKWYDRAEHARLFVHAMWEPLGGKFFTGTKEDEVTINQEVIPLDIQAWANLAHMDVGGLGYERALAYAENHHFTGSGFDFDTDRDGVWYEGTAQMAATYRDLNRMSRYQELLTMLKAGQRLDGSLPAASKDGLTTGFLLTTGEPWLYYKRSHVGATAWFILSAKGYNPFWPPKTSALPAVLLLLDD